jgi:hypothetical protein
MSPNYNNFVDAPNPTDGGDTKKQNYSVLPHSDKYADIK